MPCAPRSQLPFSSRFEFQCGEPAGEGERSRSFPFACLFGSCLSVIQRTQSPLTELLLELSLPFPFVPSPFARSSHCRSDIAISHFEKKKKNLDFASRDVFGTSTSICNSRMCCRQKWSLEHKLATSISILPTFQHASGTDPPICCQQVCP